MTSTKQYAGGLEYTNGTLEAIYFDEGRVTTNNTFYQYEYSIKDHLGNTRVTFADLNGNGQIAENEILQTDHYYPFGMRMEGYGRMVTGTENAYTYNGKELNQDFDLDWLDYGARWYDASIARWSAVDPLAEAYAPFSPYNYVLNNPIMLIDPDGRAVGEIKYSCNCEALSDLEQSPPTLSSSNSEENSDNPSPTLAGRGATEASAGYSNHDSNPIADAYEQNIQNRINTQTFTFEVYRTPIPIEEVIQKAGLSYSEFELIHTLEVDLIRIANEDFTEFGKAKIIQRPKDHAENYFNVDVTLLIFEVGWEILDFQIAFGETETVRSAGISFEGSYDKVGGAVSLARERTHKSGNEIIGYRFSDVNWVDAKEGLIRRIIGPQSVPSDNEGDLRYKIYTQKTEHKIVYEKGWFKEQTTSYKIVFKPPPGTQR